MFGSIGTTSECNVELRCVSAYTIIINMVFFIFIIVSFGKINIKLRRKCAKKQTTARD